ncbi:MAG: hypothetical protein PHT07_15240 [Paludibacter sp.]|nr:hypothetical protein [Paludibacter sp.]
MEEEVVINESYGIEVLEAQQRAQYDIQIATAKKFPRKPDAEILKKCIELATIDEDVAASCRYVLPPRDGKEISGPTVHLAQILAQQYGNMRVEATVKTINRIEKQVVSQGICFDLQTNYAVKMEVTKSIRINDKRKPNFGQLYSEDMIGVTCNRANAIAYRNAVFKVVPRSITDAVLKATIKKISDGLNDQKKLAERRKSIIESFKNTFKVPENLLLKSIGLKSPDEIAVEHIPTLRSMFQALRDGESTVEEMFNPKASDPGTPAEADKVTRIFKKKESGPDDSKATGSPGAPVINPATTDKTKTAGQNQATSAPQSQNADKTKITGQNQPTPAPQSQNNGKSNGAKRTVSPAKENKLF